MMSGLYAGEKLLSLPLSHCFSCFKDILNALAWFSIVMNDWPHFCRILITPGLSPGGSQTVVVLRLSLHALLSEALTVSELMSLQDDCYLHHRNEVMRCGQDAAHYLGKVLGNQIPLFHFEMMLCHFSHHSEVLADVFIHGIDISNLINIV